MQYVGFLLLGLGVIGLIIGLLQMLKMKKILAAPFKKTGEIASNPAVADAKGMISTEGAVSNDHAFIAPASQKPCLYYEIKVERMWEKTVATENGVKTEKGTSNVHSHEEGTTFFLNDGSGPVKVDAREKVNVELTKAFEQAQNVSYGDIHFGGYAVSVPYSGGDERTTGIRCIEKIVPAEGNLFAMGKLAGGAITKQDGMLGKLLLSTKGRDKLVGSTKTKSIIGYVLGGLMLLPGGYFSLFGEAPKDNCAQMENELKDGTCSGRYSDNAGQTFDWKVSKPGVYAITVLGTGTSKNMKLWPDVSVKKGGDEVAHESEAGGAAVKILAKFEKGSYKINVKDVSPSHVGNLKGGVGFTLDIKAQKGSDEEGVAKGKKASADDDEDKAAKDKKKKKSDD